MVSSCQNSASIVPDEGISAAVPITVSFPDIFFTKASDDAAEEAAVSDVKLLIYRVVNGNLVLDSHYDFHAAPSGIIYVYPDRPAESYVFAAYANHSKLDLSFPVRDWSDFADENLGAFRMFGTVTKTLDELTVLPKVSIDLYRQICKVSVKKISIKWNNEANYHKEFRVKAVYLTDVPGSLQMLHGIPSGESSSWWNMNGYLHGEQDELLYRNILDGVVLQDNPYESPIVLYGYISSLQNFNDDSTWEEGGTRLVIEAQHGTETVYYPVAICTAEEDKICNKHFLIEEIIITRPGAFQPYGVYPEENPIIVSCSVQEWNIINRGTVVIS